MRIRTFAALLSLVVAGCTTTSSEGQSEPNIVAVTAEPIYLALKVPFCISGIVVGSPFAAIAGLARPWPPTPALYGNTGDDYAKGSVRDINDGMVANCGPPYYIQSSPQPQPAYVAAPAPPPPPQQRNFTVYFDFNKTTLTPEARGIIQQAAVATKEVPVTHISVVGHTDTVGSAEYNQRLSEQRAQVVRAELIKDGVPADSIMALGVGKTGLAIPTAEGVKEPRNRRSVIIEGGPGT
jgi:outer membrane protein OmpA-like peptidoglycan-associated protein